MSTLPSAASSAGRAALLHLGGSAWPLFALAYSPGGRRLFTAGADGTLRAYDAHSGQFLFPLLGHRGAVLSVALSPDGTRVVSGSMDGTARISFATIEGFFAAGCRYLAQVHAATRDQGSPSATQPELLSTLRDCAELTGRGTLQPKK